MTEINSVQALINQQMGKSKWKTYDSAMERLYCLAKEDFSSIDYDVTTAQTLNLVDSPVFACKFAQQQGSEHILALANEDGRVGILDTNKMERISSQIHYNAIFDLAWMFNQMKLVTASGDHSVKLVDVSNDGIKVVRIFTGHKRSVKTLAVKHDDSSVFASGGRDGNILLWDTRSASCANFIAKSDKSIPHAHFLSKHQQPNKRKKGACLSALNSVTGLVFQDDNTLISCGAGDGVIKLWDLRKTYKMDKREALPKNTIPHHRYIRKCGTSNVLIDKTGSRLYVSCLDNVIYCYNILTCNPVPIMQYQGHRTNTYYVKSCLSKDGNYLLSGSSDQRAYIWNTKYSEPLVRLSGHSAEVTCVAWCHAGDTALVTCSDDFRHKIWRIGPETLPEDWNIEGTGKAQILTPKLTKRQLETEQINEMKRLYVRTRTCEYCLNVRDTRQCENCGSNPSTPKRINISQTWGDTKRFKFSNEVLCEKNPLVPEIETKRKLSSPTDFLLANLPNYNIDGSAPHLHYSPQKKSDKDWLTKLRTEKQFMREIREQGSPTSSKVSLDESPRTRSAKKRKLERPDLPHSPLLKFFRATNNSIMKDSACAPKASLVQETAEIE